ncbi:hypothetical protein [Roseobacter sp. CCS2]|uniref:hypothetical protein n=1 Tax=Roseobacter sp. CCS2 TaxID=391593 RepID=UPI0000F3E219|nr:hypothetical protein [Roseobacter sp. CCS2]EBA12121.1 hypothetical protein RCCS2_12529 [Roseobacter sp. CCS2]
MYYVAQTDQLVADGVIDTTQADEIQTRARAAMIAICVNSLLIAGIVAATLGLVFFLASALSVAVCGGLFLGAGLLILRYGAVLYRMFGNASALIGAGMLISGTGFELVDKVPDIAGLMMAAIGAVLAILFYWRFRAGFARLRFAYGAVLVMAVAMHLTGVYSAAYEYDLAGWPMPIIHFYVFALIAALGLTLDLRIITALAIVPFAQMLDTGTYYFSAAYVFYSPESTLSILQMSALIAACLWIVGRAGPALARQAGVLMIMAFIVANLCFLVGSIWGDTVASHLFGPERADFEDWRAYGDAVAVYRATLPHISEGIYAIVWAVLLAGLIVWAAMSNRRGMFNAAMTFAGIHAYTQMFESFYDEPLAYVIGGLAAIPLAFGLWQLNNAWFKPLSPASTQ